MNILLTEGNNQPNFLENNMEIDILTCKVSSDCPFPRRCRKCITSSICIHFCVDNLITITLQTDCLVILMLIITMNNYCNITSQSLFIVQCDKISILFNDRLISFFKRVTMHLTFMSLVSHSFQLQLHYKKTLYIVSSPIYAFTEVQSLTIYF